MSITEIGRHQRQRRLDLPMAPASVVAPGLEERFADVSGRQLRYLVSGQGKPLVLCHGFLSSAEEFGGRFGELAEHRTLIVPDLPGNGASAPLPGCHTVDAMAEAVDELLLGLGVDEFDVGGVCMGATVACALAKRAGSRAGGMVLHTPLLSPNLIRKRYRNQVRLFASPPVWRTVVWLSRQRAVSDLYKRLVVKEGDIDARTANANYDNQQRADKRAAREWLTDSLWNDHIDFLTARCEPTLIITPGQDQLVDVDRLRQVVAGLPNIQMFIDTEQSHGWNATAVHRQLAILRDFFTVQPSGALRSAFA